MGSGKSAVGRALAKRLRVELRDTDTEIERAAGKTVAEIFAETGEPEFREREHAVLTELLRGHRGVLSLGGGAVLRAESRAALAEYVADGGVVVFLDVSPEHAMARVGRDQNRPLLAGDDPERRWTAIARERRPLYEEVATMRIDTDGRAPHEVATRIARAVKP